VDTAYVSVFAVGQVIPNEDVAAVGFSDIGEFSCEDM
jgi:hypothetical protein